MNLIYYAINTREEERKEGRKEVKISRLFDGNPNP